MGDAQRGVFDFTGFLSEDGSQEFLFGGQLCLAFRGNLTDQDVLRPYFRPHVNDAPLVQVAQSLFSHVGDITGDLLGTELGVTSIGFVLLNMNRGKEVLTHDPLTNENGILEVATLPTHEGHEDVLPEGNLSIVGGGAVGNHLPDGHVIPLAHNRTLVDRSEEHTSELQSRQYLVC